MDDLNKTMNQKHLSEMGAEFERTMQFIRTHYPKAFYRPDGGKRVPRVRFEAIAVGTALALRHEPRLKPTSDAWVRSAEFEELVRTDASNSAPKLRGRIEYVRDSLLGYTHER